MLRHCVDDSTQESTNVLLAPFTGDIGQETLADEKSCMQTSHVNLTSCTSFSSQSELIDSQQKETLESEIWQLQQRMKMLQEQLLQQHNRVSTPTATATAANVAGSDYGGEHQPVEKVPDTEEDLFSSPLSLSPPPAMLTTLHVARPADVTMRRVVSPDPVGHLRVSDSHHANAFPREERLEGGTACDSMESNTAGMQPMIDIAGECPKSNVTGKLMETDMAGKCLESDVVGKWMERDMAGKRIESDVAGKRMERDVAGKRLERVLSGKRMGEHTSGEPLSAPRKTNDDNVSLPTNQRADSEKETSEAKLVGRASTIRRASPREGSPLGGSTAHICSSAHESQPTVIPSSGGTGPFSVANDNNRPLSLTAKDNQRPLSVANDNHRPLSVADDNHRPLSVADDNHRPLSI
ncbi:PREDICTED: uncharacterized protein LOC106819963, partial [Priapulus caudatus]|uniref:Uncharacterized protein LOC106819963 n=1 Tax=Priapulus caudatus TaxID=37621 RepID=A0ABM1F6E3_PRICU